MANAPLPRINTTRQPPIAFPRQPDSPGFAPVSFSHRLAGAFLLMQPLETILFLALPTSLFVPLASPRLPIWRSLLLALSVTAVYGAIGSLNDYCDYALDQLAKPKKPLVRGWVTRTYALWQALVLAIAGLLLSLALNRLTALFAAITLVLGAWYDLQAKGSYFSWAPYAAAIPSLPLWGFAAASKFTRVLLWVYPLGALLSLGLNLVQTLPDREDDVAYGLNGLAHRLSRKHALALAWTSFAGAIVGFFAAGPLVGNNWRILGPGLVAATALLLFMITDYAIFRSQASLKRNWFGGATLSVILGFAWVASLPGS